MTTTNRLEFVALVGVSVALALFVLTSQVSILYTYSKPLCHTGEQLQENQSGFDPITGMPHGRSYSCAAAGSTRPLTSFAPDPDLVDRRAVPLPIGFILGVALGVILFADRRRVRRAKSLS